MDLDHDMPQHSDEARRRARPIDLMPSAEHDGGMDAAYASWSLDAARDDLRREAGRDRP